jgi:O-antigen ligase
MPAQKNSLVIDMPPPLASVSAPEAASTESLDTALFVGLLALLIFGPLAFGATQAWSQFVQRLLALTLGAIWLFRYYRRGVFELSDNPLLLPALVFYTFIALQFATNLTAYRYATLSEALNLIPCGVVLLVAGDLFSSRTRLNQFVLVMAIFGSAVAVFALLQDFSKADKIYGVVPIHHLSSLLYGPYANHNHYAGLMEMLTPLACAAAFLERGAKRSLLLFATILMAASIVLSRSRGGVLGLAVSIAFVCLILYRRDRERRGALTILGIVAAVAILALLLANENVFHRFQEIQDHYRPSIYADSVRMWLHRPFVGFGWGTFPTVYPQFRSFYTDLFVNHAHNDYLEMLTETGLAGAALTSWFLFAVFRGGMTKIADKRDRVGSIAALGIMGGIVALLTHSLLDFNLHIPANAAMFYALCAAAATPFRRRVHEIAVTPEWEEEELEPILMDGGA